MAEVKKQQSFDETRRKELDRYQEDLKRQKEEYTELLEQRKKRYRELLEEREKAKKLGLFGKFILFFLGANLLFFSALLFLSYTDFGRGTFNQFMTYMPSVF